MIVATMLLVVAPSRRASAAIFAACSLGMRAATAVVIVDGNAQTPLTRNPNDRGVGKSHLRSGRATVADPVVELVTIEQHSRAVVVVRDTFGAGERVDPTHRTGQVIGCGLHGQPWRWMLR